LWLVSSFYSHLDDWVSPRTPSHSANQWICFAGHLSTLRSKPSLFYLGRGPPWNDWSLPLSCRKRLSLTSTCRVDALFSNLCAPSQWPGCCPSSWTWSSHMRVQALSRVYWTRCNDRPRKVWWALCSELVSLHVCYDVRCNHHLRCNTQHWLAFCWLWSYHQQ
jgi:hypothetical protein